MGTDPETPDKPPVWDEDRLWAVVRSRTIDAKSVRGSTERGGPRLRSIAQFENDGSLKYVAAAIFLIMLGGGALIVRARGRTAPAATLARVEPVHYSTPRARFATIRLTDSSQVTLAPESRLTIPPGFRQGVRDISLEGEAIFSVRHDRAHPFRVHAYGAVVEDIGTRFDVRAYRDDSTITVAVAEGTVTLGRERADIVSGRQQGAEGVLLKQGDVGSLNRDGSVSSTMSEHVGSAFEWADGHLVFANQRLPGVLRSIGRWYDLDVRIAGAELESRHVTASFATQSQSPAQMLEALALAVGAKVERAGKAYVLRPQ